MGAYLIALAKWCLAFWIVIGSATFVITAFCRVYFGLKETLRRNKTNGSNY